ncbi:intradiol ring-cleavage dioxygenase [Streptomyces sp. NBC_00091]|uniref:dioxygenase family protein n=1 Tax=Streptomyces sp. NBC_00091 TaxID=2975648 RepID=UPI002254F97A|nr:intradiol ring-cleavage dioxygenase [Streptomyces sp. NBC_00091]MCX5379382.1 intradiol ring-cleavage dioxygenase [Streptomyces sp. NBC_00091]
MTDNGTFPTSRRALLLTAGSAGIAALTAACARPAAPGRAAPAPSGGATPGCVLAVGAGAGPNYVGRGRTRSDITEGRPGVPLRLELTVVRVAKDCRPLAGAAVDIWQADSAGVYSEGKDTYLRGVQVTDGSGRCVFRTIVPGWYAGLAPHIHFKVRPDAHTETTSQFFLPDAFLREVYARQPYARRKAPRDPNARDDRYRAAGGAMTLTPVPDGTGYRAAFTVGID